MATVKRESARKGLYARFFKGETLGPDFDVEEATKFALDTATTTVQRGLECQDMETGDPKLKTWKQHVETNQKNKRKHDNPTDAEAVNSRKKKRHRDGPDAFLEKGTTLEDKATQKGRRQREAEKGRLSEFSHTEWTETAEERQHRKAAKAKRRKQQQKD